MSTPTAKEASARLAVGVLLVTCISTLVVNANTSAVTILLPAISADTGMSVDTLQWAVTGYSLIGAATIVTSGALGDVFGRRRLFLIGLTLFIASCVMIALAQDGLMVIAGRCIQGASGATILACGMSLIAAAHTKTAQLRAVTLWGAASAIGAAVGPLVGGILASTTGWQGLFWIDAAIAAVCIPITLASVKESRDPARTRSIDLAGTVLIAVILAPVIFALTNGSAWGWASLATIGCFVLSAAAVVAFILVEQRVKAPLLDLKLLRNPVLVGATIAILLGSGTINAIMYVVSLYFQDPVALGLSPLQAGLATLPVAAAAVVLAPLISPVVARIGARVTIALGFIIMTASFALLAAVNASWVYGLFVLPLVGVAAGMSLQNGPASSISTSSVPANQIGAASGISNMARYVGAAVMTAIIASVYSSVDAKRVADGVPNADALAAALSWSAISMGIWCALGIALSLLMGRHRIAKPTAVDIAAAAASTAHTIAVPVTQDDDEHAPRAGSR
jgi:EmrB/QacA subfamily drug resistance transporter